MIIFFFVFSFLYGFQLHCLNPLLLQQLWYFISWFCSYSLTELKLVMGGFLARLVGETVLPRKWGGVAVELISQCWLLYKFPCVDFILIFLILSVWNELVCLFHVWGTKSHRKWRISNYCIIQIFLPWPVCTSFSCKLICTFFTCMCLKRAWSGVSQFKLYMLGKSQECFHESSLSLSGFVCHRSSTRTWTWTWSLFCLIQASLWSMRPIYNFSNSVIRCGYWLLDRPRCTEKIGLSEEEIGQQGTSKERLATRSADLAL